jgi:hypothetical protein
VAGEAQVEFVRVVFERLMVPPFASVAVNRSAGLGVEMVTAAPGDGAAVKADTTMQAKIENRRRAAIAVTGGTLAAVAVMSVLWMRDGDAGGGPGAEYDIRGTARGARGHSSTRSPRAPGDEGRPPAAAPAPAPTPAPVLEDGRHPMFLTDIDLATSALEFDLLQYPTGDEAHRYAEAHED